MTIIIDLDHRMAGESYAELIRKTLKVRLSFKLTNARIIKSIPTIGRGNEIVYMSPRIMAVEYLKLNDDPWKIVGLRVYGKLVYGSEPKLDGKGEPVWRAEDGVNIYNHDNLNGSAVPAWIRDAAIAGTPT